MFSLKWRISTWNVWQNKLDNSCYHAQPHPIIVNYFPGSAPKRRRRTFPISSLSSPRSLHAFRARAQICPSGFPIPVFLAPDTRAVDCLPWLTSVETLIPTYWTGKKGRSRERQSRDHERPRCELINQSEVKPKTIVTYSHAFSRAWRHVFASNSDWFIWLFTTVVIGQSNYFGWFWF